MRRGVPANLRIGLYCRASAHLQVDWFMAAIQPLCLICGNNQTDSKLALFAGACPGRSSMSLHPTTTWPLCRGGPQAGSRHSTGSKHSAAVNQTDERFVISNKIRAPRSQVLKKSWWNHARGQRVCQVTNSDAPQVHRQILGKAL